ncbi:hypothetical protein [Gluconobacter frateurii]|uniref:Uncharacterized protein n=1 Tax=Gluconobacter frateurii NRIC 0228 TaxID=1307946 RepID=A0ABQ0Q9C7_9PROT|nr:hypothetical protein [Gluconobacter frateurii]GBR09800.1 hypothetical protein AA0228_0809 [Gluconobacter frateurii NRIC 0228]GLP91826.1 hypothetical protein GCM10007868_29010 [Gluconobacter frateurii]
MHRTFLLAAYIWLTFSGTLHFLIDVVSQYMRRKHVPGPETTLYYGLNTSFALGQIVFGLLCLWLVWQAPELSHQRVFTTVSFAAAAGWLAVTFAFMSYWEPRVNVIAFGILLAGALLSR